jgi:hypothetical protein
MNEEFPSPPIPADCDLRDFAFMPLDVVRLRDSDLAATPNGEVFRAAVIAWCVSWHQLPAASLPDDDAVLARLLGYGRDVKTWIKLRTAGSLHGFVKCSDGRLYHPVVAEKASDAWEAKKRQRDRTEKARQALQSRRQSQPSKPSVTDDVTASKGQGQGQREGEGQEEERLDLATLGLALAAASAAQARGPEVIRIPTNRFETKQEEVPIFQAELDDYQQTYPAVDVLQELRAMRRWSIDNRDRRKTVSGMRKFVNGWLSKEQNKGRGNGTNGSHQSGKSGAATSHQNHLAGLAALVSDEVGGPEDVPRPGELAFAARAHG